MLLSAFPAPVAGASTTAAPVAAGASTAAPAQPTVAATTTSTAGPPAAVAADGFVVGIGLFQRVCIEIFQGCGAEI